jgi:U6 snRNA-associated Sm-like protein LSm8
VITCDGRFIEGTLAGYDQLQNLILKDAEERVYQLPKEPSDDSNDVLEMVPLGLYLIRGDNVAIVGDVREGVLDDQEKSGYDGFEAAEGIKPVVQARF